MPILRNIGTLATCRADGAQGDIHSIHDAALVWEEGRIVWMGPEAELPALDDARESWDAGGRLVIPGLIDCHTHLAFGGWRAGEFEQRLLGESYQDIARAGGGIAATVEATRAVSEEALSERCVDFLHAMLRLGVTTVECKSGYGLNTENELKILRAYRRVSAMQPVRLVATLLGAHVVPKEWKADRRRYVDLVIEEMIPAVAAENLAEFCDVFVEDTAFTVDEARRILGAGSAVGLKPKLHADQLAPGGGAELAAEVRAVSADHLEHASEAGLTEMARAGTVAVALPLATLYLRQSPMAARRFVDAHVPVAVATDFNPGSAPSYDMHLALLLACTFLGLTPSEALKGATVHAARAVGRERDIGSVEPGKAADFAVIDAPDVTHWMYHFRPDTCRMTVVDGTVQWEAPGLSPAGTGRC
ncbi:MAG: imidazolonepropionase [Gemmatimonadales bacterium]|nr:imidazolonepropionase [Gemmatimonadales bacterium]